MLKATHSYRLKDLRRVISKTFIDERGIFVKSAMHGVPPCCATAHIVPQDIWCHSTWHATWHAIRSEMHACMHAIRNGVPLDMVYHLTWCATWHDMPPGMLYHLACATSHVVPLVMLSTCHTTWHGIPCGMEFHMPPGMECHLTCIVIWHGILLTWCATQHAMPLYMVCHVTVCHLTWQSAWNGVPPGMACNLACCSTWHVVPPLDLLDMAFHVAWNVTWHVFPPDMACPMMLKAAHSCRLKDLHRVISKTFFDTSEDMFCYDFLTRMLERLFYFNVDL